MMDRRLITQVAVKLDLAMADTCKKLTADETIAVLEMLAKNVETAIQVWRIAAAVKPKEG